MQVGIKYKFLLVSRVDFYALFFFLSYFWCGSKWATLSSDGICGNESTTFIKGKNLTTTTTTNHNHLWTWMNTSLNLKMNMIGPNKSMDVIIQMDMDMSTNPQYHHKLCCIS